MNLLRRVVSALVLIGVVIGCLMVGGVWLGSLVALAVIVACYEFTALCTHLGARPLPWVLYPLAVWLSLHLYIAGDLATVEIGLAAAIFVGLIGVVVIHASMSRFATALAGAVAIGLGLGYFVGLFTWSDVAWHGNSGHVGLRMVVLALAGPIVGDSAAYFGGTAFGKHRFFAAISPKKSIEGAVSAALSTIVVEAILVVVLLNWPWWQGAILGALVTVAAQGGDLAESKLKREAGVKDSSNLIPGHGGLLDRLDSLILVAPVVYWFARTVALG